MMKRKFLIAAAFLLSISPILRGQELMDAAKLTQTELTGTARSMSMGGAFGALGGDVSAIAINPAGIGVYKSSEVVATINFQNTEDKLTRPEGNMKDNKFKVNFNNLAFVGTFPLYNDAAPLLNVGFSYNRLKSFDRKYSMGWGAVNNPLSDYMAWKSQGIDHGAIGDVGWDSDVNWLSMIGYKSYLVDRGTNNGEYKTTFPRNESFGFANDLLVREKGSINSYDFNIGTTIEDMLSIGLTLSITDIDYKMTSLYVENIDAPNGQRGEFDLENELKTEGTGWQLGVGVIFKPIQELRIGVAYHSPTWYDMTDHSYAGFYHDFTNIISEMDLPADVKTKYKKGDDDTGSYMYRTEYKMRTPDKWVFSLAGVLGKNAIISFDYELMDYKKTKFDERDNSYGDYDRTNGEIKDFHRLASTIRVGGEYRFTPQFSGRVGYSWQQSPYKENMFSEDAEIYTAGATPNYIVSGDKQYFTWGLGYRFNRNIYTDIAFVYRTQESDLYAYSRANKVTHKENTFQGALTLGFRF